MSAGSLHRKLTPRQRRPDLEPLGNLPQRQIGFAPPQVVDPQDGLQGMDGELLRDRILGGALGVKALARLSGVGSF